MDQASLFIITGPVGSGKTTYLIDLLDELQKEGIRAGGFVSEKSLQPDTDHDYSIRDVQSGRSVPLSTRSAVDGWTQIRHFYFNPKAISLGNQILDSVSNSDTDLLVIDEVGPFELDGEIWSSSLERLLSRPGPSMIWVAREGILDAITVKWNLTDPVIIKIADLPVHETLKKILSKLESTS